MLLNIRKFTGQAWAKSREEMQAAQGTWVLFWVPQRTREGECRDQIRLTIISLAAGVGD